jgi:hypothetical protein
MIQLPPEKATNFRAMPVTYAARVPFGERGDKPGERCRWIRSSPVEFRER